MTAASGSYSKGDDRYGREARESVLKVMPGASAHEDLEDQIRDLIERTASLPDFVEDLLGSGTMIVLSIATFPELYSSHILLPRDLLRQVSNRGWAVEFSWYRTGGGAL